MKIHRRDTETQNKHGRTRSELLCVSASLWVVLIALGYAGCSRKPAAILPEQAGGWAKQGETRTFTADNLYDYIDGGAEKYVQAGVKETLTSDYSYQGSSNAGAADVFVMSGADGARKVFESQAEAGSKPVQVGDAARLYSQSLTFRKGNYFVRLVAYDQRAGEALVELGRALEAKLP